MAEPRSDVATRVREYILETWGYRFENEQFADTDSLFESGSIDSFGVLDLVVFLEETFEISISDDDMDASNLDSITAMSAFVQRKQNQA